MKVRAVKTPAGQEPVVYKRRVSAAGRGAIAAAGLCGISNIAFRIAKPQEMDVIIKDCGGKSKYAMNLAVGMAMFSAIGAGISSVLNAASKKVHSGKSPKAVN